MKSTLKLFSWAFNINSSNQPLLIPATAGLPRGTPISSNLCHNEITSSTDRLDWLIRSGSLNVKTFFIKPESANSLILNISESVTPPLPQNIGTYSILRGLSSFKSLFQE